MLLFNAYDNENTYEKNGKEKTAISISNKNGIWGKIVLQLRKMD